MHGGDVYFTAPRYPAGERAVRRAFGAARLVLANSAGIEEAARRLGARATRVVHLGTDVPEQPALKEPDLTLVTVAHLVARKRHADVVRALWLLRERHPQLRYLIVGDGPEREPLARLAGELGVADRVEFTGQLPREEALARARAGHVFVMPSVDEAFGVAYVEAMAAGLPAVGARGEAGPQEIAAAGDGLRLVPPADVEALAAELDALLAEPGLPARARRPRPRHRLRRLHLGAVRARDGAGLRGRAAVSARPVLFVTNHVPPDRAGAFRALHERVALELALFGGRSHHATAGVDDPGVPFRRVAQREVHALAASGRYGAVVCGTAGRVALPAAFLGAERARTPFVLWSALWGDLRTPAHLAARPLLRRIHRARGGRRRLRATRRPPTPERLGARAVAVAPQAVDNAFWATPRRR